MATCFGNGLKEPGRVLIRMRSRLVHRGPDDAGLILDRNVALAQTRLAVVDPTPAGHQPMCTPDGRFTLCYNGELYNDHDLRRTLDPGIFQTSCDTETVLALLAAGGSKSLGCMRGMFALALFDQKEQTLLLARDPLGIKPLYFWRGAIKGSPHLLFASEPTAVLAHPGVPIRPDLIGISGYLTTIRTIQGSRTLFEGIQAVEPGQWIEFNLRDRSLKARQGAIGQPDPGHAGTADPVETVRTTIIDSVQRHLRTDVPMCTLLSGGLDSTIITAIAAQEHQGLVTYCAGASDSGPNSDLDAARQVASALGVEHRQVEIDQALFLRRWPEMIDRLGVPLSTPNEVAIHEVAKALSRDGFKVVLSGEGADELFAGYDRPLGNTRQFLLQNPQANIRERVEFELESNGWVPPTMKGALFQPQYLQRLERDECLFAWQQAVLERCDAEAFRSDGPGDKNATLRLKSHLLMQERINLAGLLRRLDTSSMLASVEGRTPFADAGVADCAHRLGLDQLIEWTESGAHTKKILRSAFEGRIPEVALRRPKASFPLPFTTWLGKSPPNLAGSSLLRELFLPEVLEIVEQSPEQHWRIAWPVFNLAIWEQRWWGIKNRPGNNPSGLEINIPSPKELSGDAVTRPDHPAQAVPDCSASE